jgi:hypothetical protein
MKQVKQHFELTLCKAEFYEKLMKQNETTFKSAFVSCVFIYFVDYDALAK